MKPRRRLTHKQNGLFTHSNPPKVVSPHPSVIRQWLRGGEVDKLEGLVMQGQGHKLLGEYASDLKVRAFLKTIPAILARMDMVHEAADKGNLADLRTLLKHTADGGFPRRRLAQLAVSKDRAGAGLLHKAVYRDHRDMVQWLVQTFPDTVKVTDREGRTALHYSGRSSDPEWTWTILRQAGADSSLLDTAGRSPAYYMDNPQEARLPTTEIRLPPGRFTSGNNGLVVKPANIRIWIHDQDLGRLQQVVWEGQGDRLRTETSQHPAVKQFLSAVPYIMGVIKDVHTAAVTNDVTLLKKRTAVPVPADILLAKDSNGLTALHKAAGLGHVEVARAILETCPEAVGRADKEGKTPLHYAAAARGSGAIYDTLLEHQASEDTLDKKGHPPNYYIQNSREVDQRVLSVVPDAPRTANTFPPSWDWGLLGGAIPKQPPNNNNTDSAFEDTDMAQDDSPDIPGANNLPEEITRKSTAEIARPLTYDIDADEGVEEGDEEKEKGYNADSDEQEGHYEAEYAEVDPDYELENGPFKPDYEDSTENKDHPEKEENRIEDNEGERVEGRDNTHSSIINVGKSIVDEGIHTLGNVGIRNSTTGMHVDTQNVKRTAVGIDKNATKGMNRAGSRIAKPVQLLKNAQKAFKSGKKAVADVEKNINDMIYKIDKTIKDDIEITKSFLEKEQDKVKHDVKSINQKANNELSKQIKYNSDKISNKMNETIKETSQKTVDQIKSEKDKINSEIEKSIQNNKYINKVKKIHNNIKNVDLKNGRVMTDGIVSKTHNFIEQELDNTGKRIKNTLVKRNNKVKKDHAKSVTFTGNETKNIGGKMHLSDIAELALKESVNQTMNNAKSKDNNNKAVKVQTNETKDKNNSSGYSSSSTAVVGQESQNGRFTVYKPAQKHWKKLSEYTRSNSIEESLRKIEEIRGFIPKHSKFLSKNDEPTMDGEQRIRRAVESGNMEELASLVLSGEGGALARHRSADPDVQTFIDNIPNYITKIQKVHRSSREGDLRALQSALDRRKFAVARESTSQLRLTPLHVAVLYQRIPVIKFLCGRFPETLEMVDAKGRSPLHYAAIIQDRQCYNLLTELGADNTLEDMDGKTPEYYLAHPEYLMQERLKAEFEGNETSTPAQDKPPPHQTAEGLSEKAVVSSSSGFPLFGPEDGQYLASSLGQPLIKGLTEVATRRPQNPVKYLAQYLDSYQGEELTPKVLEQTYVVGSVSDNMVPPPPIAATPTAAVIREVEDKVKEEESRPETKDTPEVPQTAFKPVQRDEFGQTILHFAMARSHSRNAVYQLLQEVDCNLGYRDELYRTPRDVAVQVNINDNVTAIDKYVVSLAAGGEVDRLRELLMEGYDHIVDAHDEGAAIGEVANERGQTAVLGFLESIQQFEEKRERLHRAIRLASAGQAQDMLKLQPGLAVAKNQYGRSSLHIAVLNQHDQLVKHIANAYPQTLVVGDNLMRTALHYAMGVERVETLSRTLIQAGAARVVKDLKGRQPSYYFMNKSDIQKLQDEEDMLRV